MKELSKLLSINLLALVDPKIYRFSWNFHWPVTNHNFRLSWVITSPTGQLELSLQTRSKADAIDSHTQFFETFLSGFTLLVTVPFPHCQTTRFVDKIDLICLKIHSTFRVYRSLVKSSRWSCPSFFDLSMILNISHFPAISTCTSSFTNVFESVHWKYWKTLGINYQDWPELKASISNVIQ